jgi:predicted RNA methylase
LTFTKLKPEQKILGKDCLDAGCGIGRYTYALQKLGARNVNSLDISQEAINKCKEINPNAFVFNIMNLLPNPIYDFVLSWAFFTI